VQTTLSSAFFFCWWRARRCSSLINNCLARMSCCELLQTEFAEPWEEFGGEIGLHHCVGREPRLWLCGSLESHCRKPCWLHMRLSTLKRDWATCFVKKRTSFSMRSLRRDLKASLAWDFGDNGAWGEKLLKLLLVELDDEWFDRRSEKLEVGLRYGLLISGENIPQRNGRKIWRCVKSLLIVKKVTTD